MNYEQFNQSGAYFWKKNCNNISVKSEHVKVLPDLNELFSFTVLENGFWVVYSGKHPEDREYKKLQEKIKAQTEAWREHSSKYIRTRR